MSLFRRCAHAHLRCVHGDEIIARDFCHRAVCLDCGKGLPHLPAVCSVTNKLHGIGHNYDVPPAPTGGEE